MVCSCAWSYVPVGGVVVTPCNGVVVRKETLCLHHTQLETAGGKTNADFDIVCFDHFLRTPLLADDHHDQNKHLLVPAVLTVMACSV